MAFSDLFISGAQKENIAHFSSIVRLALVDEVISDGEKQLLDRMAIGLNISKRKYDEILKNPNKYPTTPLVSHDNRIERLYNLTKMIFADNEAIEKEAAILVKVGVALGFPIENVDKIAEEAIQLAMNDISLENFTKAIKSIDKE